MMLDQNIVAVSPSSSWRVLSKAGLLQKWNQKPSLKGTGFVQPLLPHEHWHVDVSYLNIRGTFYYLCSLLDGCSRAIIHWEIREQMTERDVEIILERAKEKYPAARPRIISDNGLPALSSGIIKRRNIARTCNALPRYQTWQFSPGGAHGIGSSLTIVTGVHSGWPDTA